MMYLYGLLAQDAPPDTGVLAGLDGVTGPARSLPTAAGHLILGDVPEARILPRRKHLLAHARVLERCMRFGPLLPMRFGMVVDDSDGILAMLEAARPTLQRQFELVAGHAEFGLKVALPRQEALEATLAAEPALAAERRRLAETARPPHLAAADFGRRLAEALDRRRGVAQKAITAAIAPRCRAHVLATPEEDVQVLHLHALLPPDEAEDLAARAQEAAADSGFAPGATPRVRLVGPVPPFNFTRVAIGSPRSEAA
jgi:hypothetical protein